MNEIKIENFVINSSSEPFTIAEAGINHNGNLDTALKMITEAKKAGVCAIKFFTYKTEEFIIDSKLEYTYKSQGKDISESMKAMFERCELSREDWKKIKQKCDEENIIFLSTPENFSDLEFLIELGMKVIKIGSDDFTNISMIKKFLDTKLPIIMSCGMSSMDEIRNTISKINIKNDYPLVLMFTTSQYPTPDEDVNMLKLKTIKNEFSNIILGYSDHTQGNIASTLANTLGAKVFEKHFTIDKNLPGPDHWFSASPNELKEWNQAIKRSWVMQGSNDVKPTINELKNKKAFRRKLVALKNIEKGDKFSEDTVGMRRTKSDNSFLEIEKVIGRLSARRINYGEIIDLECIE
tara:strand:- start:4440 stop:5492 length:1053 start_codon:yes stop_codon:yes gene_type:complete